jgi:hypothetical protein
MISPNLHDIWAMFFLILKVMAILCWAAKIASAAQSGNSGRKTLKKQLKLTLALFPKKVVVVIT